MGPSHFKKERAYAIRRAEVRTLACRIFKWNDRNDRNFRRTMSGPITFFRTTSFEVIPNIHPKNPHKCTTLTKNGKFPSSPLSLETMIQKQIIMKHHECHHQPQQGSNVFEAEQDKGTSSSWTVARGDNSSSRRSTKKRVQWKDHDTCDSNTLMDCRWGNSSWSSHNDDHHGFQSLATSIPATTSPRTTNPDLISSCKKATLCSKTSPSSTSRLECPKRRVSMDAAQLVSFLTQAMESYND